MRSGKKGLGRVKYRPEALLRDRHIKRREGRRGVSVLFFKVSIIPLHKEIDYGILL